MQFDNGDNNNMLSQMEPHDLERRRQLARHMLVTSGCANPTQDEIDEVVEGAYRRMLAQQQQDEERKMRQEHGLDHDDDHDDNSTDEDDDDVEQQQQERTRQNDNQTPFTGNSNGASQMPAFPAFGQQPQQQSMMNTSTSNNNNNNNNGSAFRKSPVQYYTSSNPPKVTYYGNNNAAAGSNQAVVGGTAASGGLSASGMSRPPATHYLAQTEATKARNQQQQSTHDKHLPLHQRRFSPLVDASSSSAKNVAGQSIPQNTSSSARGPSQQQQPPLMQHVDPNQMMMQEQQQQELRRLNRAAVNYTLLGLSSKVFHAVGHRLEANEKRQLMEQQQQQGNHRSARSTSAGRGAIVDVNLPNKRNASTVNVRAGQRSTLSARKKSDPVAKGVALRNKWDRQAEEKRKSRKQLAWEVRQSMML